MDPRYPPAQGRTSQQVVKQLGHLKLIHRDRARLSSQRKGKRIAIIDDEITLDRFLQVQVIIVDHSQAAPPQISSAQIGKGGFRYIELGVAQQRLLQIRRQEIGETKVHPREMSVAEISSLEIDIIPGIKQVHFMEGCATEIWANRWMLCPPCIPRRDPLSQDIKMLLVCDAGSFIEG